MAASSSWVCELSGEPLDDPSTANDDSNPNLVVTPSGHVCLQRYLALTLSSNGNIDPFLTNSNVPLTLEDCIVLKKKKTTKTKNPSSDAVSTAASSFPQLLQQVQRDYDAVVLELFETRQLLQSTRKELSQALYQQDAAVRVIARLMMEKNNNNIGEENVDDIHVAAGVSKKRARIEVPDQDENVSRMSTANNTKTPPPTPTDPAALGAIVPSVPRPIPPDDVTVMQTVWLRLSQARKKMVQQASKQAIANLSSFGTVPMNKMPFAILPGHRLTSILAAKACESQYQVLVGTTIQPPSSSSSLTLMVWKNPTTNDAPIVVDLSVPLSSANQNASVWMDLQPPHVVMVAPTRVSNELWWGLYHLESNTLTTTTITTTDATTSSDLMQLHMHPSAQHVMLTYRSGLVMLYRISNSNNNNDNALSVVPLTHWQPTMMTKTTMSLSSSLIPFGVVSALHPDGYLHAMAAAAASSSVQPSSPVIYVYDTKAQSVALTLTLAPEPANDETTTATTTTNITALCFSPNGYHLAMALWQQQQDTAATTTSSTALDHGTCKLAIWDLRKETIVDMITLPSSATSTEFPTTSRPVVQLTFDPSGKSLAFALDDHGIVACTNFKTKTKLNEPVLLYVPHDDESKDAKNNKNSNTMKKKSPSSLSWPMANRIVVTYKKKEDEEEEPKKKNHDGMEEDGDEKKEDALSDVICVLEAPTKKAT